MLAVTSDKALLRAVWEVVEENTNRTAISLSEAAARLSLNGNGVVDVDALESDAQLLQDLGFLKLATANGSQQVELTQVGAFLATRLTL